MRVVDPHPLFSRQLPISGLCHTSRVLTQPMYAGERFNSITHIIGSVLAVIGTIFAINAVIDRDATTIAAIAIYGAMLIVLYLSSTLYHSLRGPAKNVFHVFDHCAIYLLIAGTYTPITLITLRGPWGWCSSESSGRSPLPAC